MTYAGESKALLAKALITWEARVIRDSLGEMLSKQASSEHGECASRGHAHLGLLHLSQALGDLGLPEELEGSIKSQMMEVFAKELIGMQGKEQADGVVTGDILHALAAFKAKDDIVSLLYKRK